MMRLFINEIHFCLFLKVSIYKCDWRLLNGKDSCKILQNQKSDISRNKIYILFLGKKYQKLKAFSQTYFWSNDVIRVYNLFCHLKFCKFNKIFLLFKYSQAEFCWFGIKSPNKPTYYASDITCHTFLFSKNVTQFIKCILMNLQLVFTCLQLNLLHWIQSPLLHHIVIGNC